MDDFKDIEIDISVSLSSSFVRYLGQDALPENLTFGCINVILGMYDTLKRSVWPEKPRGKHWNHTSKVPISLTR